MDEYIKRETVNKLLKAACDECRDTCEEFDGFYADCNQCIMHSVVKGVPAIPAANVRPVVRAEWEAVDQEEPRTYGCSACKRLSKFPHAYCPNCGATMEWRA